MLFTLKIKAHIKICVSVYYKYVLFDLSALTVTLIYFLKTMMLFTTLRTSLTIIYVAWGLVKFELRLKTSDLGNWSVMACFALYDSYM